VTSRARLIATSVPPTPEGAVLVLHGGASRRSAVAVSPTQLSVVRMLPVAARIARAGRGRLAVFRLLNSTRGWDTGHTPVDDAVWAMGQLRERLGVDLPTSLVGHSLGGRAALLAADRPSVRSAVALAPWVYPSDGDAVDLRGRRVLVVHGDEDRVADPRRSLQVAERLGRTTDVGYVRVTGGKHAMLSHGRVFERAAADFVTATLLGSEPGSPVREVLAGHRLVEV
jgi:pimeloyl-ACP methyl ester carboxylesterase